MQIAMPIIHLEKEGASTYHIHVITWFDYTKFKADGSDTIPTVATDGVYTITLFVTEDSTVPNMQLLTPVVHTLTLTGVELTVEDPLIEVQIYNTFGESLEGKRKVHREGATSSAMPDPGSGNRP
jgi:hypothetical protein